MKTNPISRQRAYQLRHKAAGLCTLCSQKATHGDFCETHYALNTGLQRKRGGFKPWKEGGRGRPPKYKLTAAQ